MSSIEVLKKKVREFQQRTNFGRSDEDNFTPWWLQQRFKLADDEATKLCSDGNFDFGLDGFHIMELQDKTILSLVQSKFSEDFSQIKKGINDINRFMPTLSKMLKGLESDSVNENILITRLRPKVGKIQISDNRPLEINAYVICLSDSPKEYIESRAETNIAELNATIRHKYDNHNIYFSFKVVGLHDLIEDNKSISYRPSKPYEIYFNGSDEIDMNGSIFLSGLGKLSDFVELYKDKGNQLFAKNVRLYLYGKKNETIGPAGKIKETLLSINSGSTHPEKFAFLHNGITIYANKININRENKNIEISDPSILNGCQTIKSSFFFYQDQIEKDRLNYDIWKSIPVSIRFVVTEDDELWREVAESNNRQNSMKASALRANDKIQIELENQFEDMKIFYQRQEKAFANISRSEQDMIEEYFSNSPDVPISIETLAQTIVCASDLPLSYASRQNEIFESYALYSKVFSNKHLINLSFLVFAHNVRSIVDLAIKKAIPEDTKKYKHMKHKEKNYKDLFTRLLLKIIIKEKLSWLIDEYNTTVIKRRGLQAVNLTEELRKIIKSQGTPVFKLIGEHYWDDENNKCHPQDNQGLLDLIINKLKLRDIDVFQRVT